eukprot:29216-Eustigmatos_ZCMA.PRE.1
MSGFQRISAVDAWLSCSAISKYHCHTRAHRHRHCSLTVLDTPEEMHVSAFYGEHVAADYCR